MHTKGAGLICTICNYTSAKSYIWISYLNRILLRIVLTEPGITFYGHVYAVHSSNSLQLYIIFVYSCQFYTDVQRIH